MSIDIALYAFPDVGRPWVRTNFVTTLDGAAQDARGVTASLGGHWDKVLFAQLRALADVILVGAGTARTERYGPDDTTPIAVVSRSLDIPHQLLQPGVTVVTTADAPADQIAQLNDAGADVLACGEFDVDWAAMLDAFAQRGWTKINCEGGPTLHGELLGAGLVDELCLTIAPVLASGDAQRIAHGPTALEMGMHLAHAVPVEDVLFTRWVRQP